MLAGGDLMIIRPRISAAVTVALLLFFAMGNSWKAKPQGVAADIQGTEELMQQKEHGSCSQPVQENLRWDCSQTRADKICCFNRHYAEYSGYWTSTTFLKSAEVKVAKEGKEITFYDSVTGKALFIAPRGRSWDAFLAESRAHGWPSFRDEEVLKEHVRILPNGEAVSTGGTHLGHNLPDRKGNRYCINLVSVAGRPEQSKSDL